MISAESEISQENTTSVITSMGASSSSTAKNTKNHAKHCSKNSANSKQNLKSHCWTLSSCHRNSSSAETYFIEVESFHSAQKYESNGLTNSMMPESAIIKKQCQEIADGTVINDSWQHNDFNHNDLDHDRDIGFLQLGSETSENFVTTPTSELPSTPSSHLALPISNYDPSITSYSEYSLRNCAEYTLTEHTQDMLLQIIRCFPFPSPRPSPKPSRRNTEKSIITVHKPHVFETTPSTSEEKENDSSSSQPSPSTTTSQTTHGLFRKNKLSAGFSHLLGRHRVVHRVSSDTNGVQGRPHSPSNVSATSAPTMGNGNDESGQQSTQSSMRGILSKLCQKHKHQHKADKIAPQPYISCSHHPEHQKHPPVTEEDSIEAENGRLKLLCSRLCSCSLSRQNEVEHHFEKNTKSTTRRIFPKLKFKKAEKKRKSSYCEPEFNSTCSALSEVCSSATPAEACLLDHFMCTKLINSPNSSGSKTMFNQILRKSLLQVSVDTMAITALPLDCWLKERLKNWVQLSGHEGTIVPATNHSLYKKQPSSNLTEAKAYQEIMKDKELAGLTPIFYKEITHKNESFIEIQDLLADFPNTSTRSIMDIKIGTRTFLESEVLNTAKRKDLYQKMIDIDPDEPTEEEKEEQAITKLRYMQFRERESSTATFGFRIEAAQLPTGKLQRSFKKIKTREQISETLIKFFDGRVEELCHQALARLRQIRTGVEKSEFFRTHEVVGSSILIVYDESKLSAWMIDFAKSTKVPCGIELNHRSEWELGNHEDGYLTGVENLISIFDECSRSNAQKNMKNQS